MNYTCTQCGKSKPVKEYTLSKNGKPRQPCKICYNKKRMDTYYRNKDKTKQVKTDVSFPTEAIVEKPITPIAPIAPIDPPKVESRVIKLQEVIKPAKIENQLLKKVKPVKNSNFRVDHNILRRAKIQAIIEDISLNELLKRIIGAYLDHEKTPKP